MKGLVSSMSSHSDIFRLMIELPDYLFVPSYSIQF